MNIWKYILNNQLKLAKRSLATFKIFFIIYIFTIILNNKRIHIQVYTYVYIAKTITHISGIIVFGPPTYYISPLLRYEYHVYFFSLSRPTKKKSNLLRYKISIFLWTNAIHIIQNSQFESKTHLTTEIYGLVEIFIKSFVHICALIYQ